MQTLPGYGSLLEVSNSINQQGISAAGQQILRALLLGVMEIMPMNPCPTSLVATVLLCVLDLTILMSSHEWNTVELLYGKCVRSDPRIGMDSRFSPVFEIGHCELCLMELWSWWLRSNYKNTTVEVQIFIKSTSWASSVTLQTEVSAPSIWQAGDIASSVMIYLMFSEFSNIWLKFNVNISYYAIYIIATINQVTIIMKYRKVGWKRSWILDVCLT